MGLLEPYGRYRGRSGQGLSIQLSDEPVIVVHGKEHAVAALSAAAEADIAVLLVSQQGGVSVWGAEAFKALMEQAVRQVPQARFRWALDCGDDPGYALAACRTGVAGIVFATTSAAFDRIADIARQSGVAMFSPDVYQGKVLDLSQVGDTRAACDTFLIGDINCE